MTSSGYGKRKSVGGESNPENFPGVENWLDGEWRKTEKGHAFRLFAKYKRLPDRRIGLFFLYFRKKVDRLGLQLAFKSSIKLRLLPRGFYDSWARKKSLAVRVKSGESTLDDDFLVDCEDQAVAGQILGDKKVRRAVFQAFSRGVREVILSPDGAFFELGTFMTKRKPLLVEEEAQKDIEKLVDLLQPVIRTLPEHKDRCNFFSPDYGLRIFWIAIAAFCVALFLKLDFGCDTPGLECGIMPGQYVFLPYLLVATATSVLLWWLWLKCASPKSMRHIYALRAGALALAICIGGYPMIPGLNRYLSTDEGRWIFKQVSDKRIMRKGTPWLEKERSPTGRTLKAQFEIQIKDWRANGENLWLEVWEEMYDEVQINHGCLGFRVREGAFGYTFLSDLGVYRFEGGGCPTMGDGTKGVVR